MGAKRSEYQNQFKPSIVKQHQTIYRENLLLRQERRDREFMHTPLCWGEQNPEADDGSLSEDSEGDALKVRKTSKLEKEQDATVYLSIAEIMAESTEKSNAIRHQKLIERSRRAEVPCIEKMSLQDCEANDVNKDNEESKNFDDKSVSIHDIVDKENRKLNQKIAQTYVFDNNTELFLKCNDYDGEDEAGKSKTEERKVPDLKENFSNLRKKNKKRSNKKPVAAPSNKHKSSGKGRSIDEATAKSVAPTSDVPCLSLDLQKSKRPERPDRKMCLSRSKRRSASAVPSQTHNKPPFVAYGSADIENNLALHRTHNVLCPSDVYQPALRAKTRREEEQRRCRERAKAARAHVNADDVLDRLSAASLTPRDLWASEYSQQFHGYEPREYERAVSARSVLPRPTSAVAAPPFRTGGCRIVHVD